MATYWTTAHNSHPDFTDEPGDWTDAHSNTNDGPALSFDIDGDGLIVEGDSREQLVAWLRDAADVLEAATPDEDGRVGSLALWKSARWIADHPPVEADAAVDGRVLSVLRMHPFAWESRLVYCGCGEDPDGDDRTYEQHLARALRSAGVLAASPPVTVVGTVDFPYRFELDQEVHTPKGQGRITNRYVSPINGPSYMVVVGRRKLGFDEGTLEAVVVPVAGNPS